MTILVWKQAAYKLVIPSARFGRCFSNIHNVMATSPLPSSCCLNIFYRTLQRRPSECCQCRRDVIVRHTFLIQFSCNSTISRRYLSGTTSDDNSGNKTSHNDNAGGSGVDQSTVVGSGADQSTAVPKLPRRVAKRLQKQGISETEYLSRLNAAPTEFPRDSFSPDAFTGKSMELEEMLKNMSTHPHHLSEADSFPSDIKRQRQMEKQQASVSAEQKIAPSTTSIMLFPGQGCQFVGMGKKLLEFPGVRDLYDEANSILGYDLLSLCLRGPKSELDKTIYCQPAVLITSLAAIEKCREEHQKAVENCVATAGFSVGEFAALVFSGVLSFPDAVKLVKVRAEAMQKASEKIGSGMLTVFLAHDSDLKQAIKMAKEYCIQRRNIEEPVCSVANYLFPECKVLAGHEEGLEFIATNAKEFNIIKTKRLPVSGAFHTILMESAVKPFQGALAGMQIGRPKIPVYSNVTSQPYHPKTNFSHMLSQQLVKPVKWEQILHDMYSRKQGEEFPNTYEVGPGRQMGTLLKQVNLQAYKQYHSIDV